MVCKECAQAAENGTEHPQDCDCTCQHKPKGSWKGEK